MSRSRFVVRLAILVLYFGLFGGSSPSSAQTITATIEGRITDTSGGAIPKATVTGTNSSRGISRSDVTSDQGDYRLALLPVGEYTVTVEVAAFQKQAKKVTLVIGQVATVDFTLQVGQLTQQLVVEQQETLLEPTRTEVSSVISYQQIQSLPVNGRQFIDFVLLAPGVKIGDTTSGSTDVIVEPVTKISFAGQNIHYNFIAIDGADNISTASGIQKTTPSQEAVQEFRVVNTVYSTEFGRAVGGIVNIITKSGTNTFHGSLYEFFRNTKLDAKGILASPDPNTCRVRGDVTSGGCSLLAVLRQNQFGASLGGPLVKERTFFFTNYEGQRRGESPFYNSTVLRNITDINTVKVGRFGLPAENLNVLRSSNADNFLAKLDHSFTKAEALSVRYFFNDARFTNVSPLNDGFDLPSGFKDNNLRDQSLVANLFSGFSSELFNELRGQYAHRSFDFPTVSTQPHLEVANTFAVGVNRGNPDFYQETRFELVDNVTKIHGRHTIQFGGNFNFVRTTESFPLFYPFEATFGSLDAFLGRGAFATTGPAPFVIFFERFKAPNFTEPTINPAVYQGRQISSAVRNQAKGVLNHTYNGFFLQDKARFTSRLTLNFGLRYEFETWPSNAVNNPMKNFDPRLGLAYNIGTKWNLVLRAGAGIFHGVIPSPLLMCQIPSCGGTLGKYPGRENKEDDLNATTRLFAFASGPGITSMALSSLLSGTYPDAVPAGFCGGFLSGCGFFGDAVIVRFAKDHKPPYGLQTSLTLEMEPIKGTALSFTYQHVRGVHLGSFFNVNQPDPSGQVLVHDSQGRTGLKNTYFCPVAICGIPGLPGTRDPRFAVYFEADSRWDSVYDGLLINVQKQLRKYVGYGISYTFSKTLDNGPNPSFVLIPQDSKNFRAERALSSDDARHRFVGNATFASPTNTNIFLRNYQFSGIVTLESPHFFTKFAGFDANGDVFGVNDRVGIESRNTFRGDPLKTVDVRLSRTFRVREQIGIEVLAEAFNLLNSVNMRFFNTTYGAADFCPVGGAAVCGTGPFFKEGSPNREYGTPRAVFNPRQIQLGLKLTF